MPASVQVRLSREAITVSPTAANASPVSNGVGTEASSWVPSAASPARHNITGSREPAASPRRPVSSPAALAASDPIASNRISRGPRPRTAAAS